MSEKKQYEKVKLEKLDLCKIQTGSIARSFFISNSTASSIATIERLHGVFAKEDRELMEKRK